MLSGMLRVALACFEALGVNSLFRFFNRNKAIVLWYHGVRDDDARQPANLRPMHLRLSTFRAQLDYLRRHGYTFVTMSGLASRFKSRGRIGRLAVVTFDDGYENVAGKAYPVMLDCGAKGCLYAVQGLLGTGEALWTDYVAMCVARCASGDVAFPLEDEYPLDAGEGEAAVFRRTGRIVNRMQALSSEERRKRLDRLQGCVSGPVPGLARMAPVEQVRSLDPEVLEIGSHTRTHPDCTALETDAELESELAGSRQELERAMGYGVRHFCYPFGSYNDRVVDAVRRSGYETATTTVAGLVGRDSDLLRLRRVGGTEDMLLFKAMASGTVLAPLRVFMRAREMMSQNGGRRWRR